MILLKISYHMGVKFETLNIPVILAITATVKPTIGGKFEHFFHIFLSAVKSFKVV